MLRIRQLDMPLETPHTLTEKTRELAAEVRDADSPDSAHAQIVAYVCHLFLF